MKYCIYVSVEFLPSDEGGRKNPVYLNDGGYRPHFRVNGNTEYLGVQFLEGPDRIINPNERVTAKVWLMYHPDMFYDKLSEGKEFEILEGAKVVGRGVAISPPLNGE
jgi:translation elongation factor EF-Tu-like GTPase